MFSENVPEEKLKITTDIDATYYSFDIKAYTPPEPITDPEYNQNEPPEYTLNKYTPSEFLNLYPDYFAYGWYYHHSD